MVGLSPETKKLAGIMGLSQFGQAVAQGLMQMGAGGGAAGFAQGMGRGMQGINPMQSAMQIQAFQSAQKQQEREEQQRQAWQTWLQGQMGTPPIAGGTGPGAPPAPPGTAPPPGATPSSASAPGAVQYALAAGGGPTPAAASMLPPQGSPLARLPQTSGSPAPPAAPQASMTPNLAGIPPQVLMAMDPAQGAAFLMQQRDAQLKAAQPFNVPAGATVYDPRTRQPVYTAPAKPQTPTTLQRNLTAAGLTPGSPEYQAAMLEAINKPNVSVNMGNTGVDYGDPPKDMAWARNPDGSVATRTDLETGYQTPIAVGIGGGPIEQEAKVTAEAKAQQDRQREAYANIVVQDIDRINEIIDESFFPVTGLWSSLAGIPGSPQHNVAALLDTLSATVSFDRLQQMREASPTGGALGQVSNLELGLLGSTLGSLRQSQSEEQFRRNLGRLREQMTKVITGPDKYTPEEIEREMKINRDQIADGGQTTPYSQMTPAELSQVDIMALSGSDLDDFEKAMNAARGQ